MVSATRILKIAVVVSGDAVFAMATESTRIFVDFFTVCLNGMHLMQKNLYFPMKGIQVIFQ